MVGVVFSEHVPKLVWFGSFQLYHNGSQRFANIHGSNGLPKPLIDLVVFRFNDEPGCLHLKLISQRNVLGHIVITGTFGLLMLESSILLDNSGKCLCQLFVVLYQSFVETHLKEHHHVAFFQV